jgi:hypothetical protein
MPLKRWMYETAALTIALVIVAFMFKYLMDSHDFAMRDGHPIFGDFIGFWSAGRATLDGHLAQIHDERLIYQYHTMAAPGVRFVAHWSAPPTFLLIVTPLALLPFPAAALTFLAASAAIYFCAARKLLPDARALLFAATLPAAVYHLGNVQTGLLVAGVSGLALYWLDRRPRLAGALVGLLAIKPHLALLWPVLLALTGRWRAFAAAALSATAFVVLGMLAFGIETYARFFENLSATQQLITAQRITTPAYASLYANLLSLDAPLVLAIAAQGLSALAALGLSAWVFWRGQDRPVQSAALCAATLLISPYLFFYDFPLLAVGAALLGAPRDRFELAAIVAAWSAGLSLPLGYLVPVPLCPLAAWLILLAAARRARGAAYPTRRTQDLPISTQS